MAVVCVCVRVQRQCASSPMETKNPFHRKVDERQEGVCGYSGSERAVAMGKVMRAAGYVFGNPACGSGRIKALLQRGRR